MKSVKLFLIVLTSLYSSQCLSQKYSFLRQDLHADVKNLRVDIQQASHKCDSLNKALEEIIKANVYGKTVYGTTYFKSAEAMRKYEELYAKEQKTRELLELYQASYERNIQKAFDILYSIFITKLSNFEPLQECENALKECEMFDESYGKHTKLLTAVRNFIDVMKNSPSISEAVSALNQLSSVYKAYYVATVFPSKLKYSNNQKNIYFDNLLSCYIHLYESGLIDIPMEERKLIAEYCIRTGFTINH